MTVWIVPNQGIHSHIFLKSNLIFYTEFFHWVTILRVDVSKYRPEVYKSEKTKILKKIYKVAVGKLLA